MRKALFNRRGGTALQLAAAAGLGSLFVAASAQAQTFAISLGIRETGTTVGIGENGGATGGIEWVNLDAQIMPADGAWHQITFNFQTDPLTAFAGATANGAYDGTRGTIEHIRIRNSGGTTDLLTFNIDDIVNTVGGTPTVVSGFEAADPFPATVGTGHMFQTPRFSGSTDFNLYATPNTALVTDAIAHSGTQSLELKFGFNGTNGTAAWDRLTTFNGPVQPNPTIDWSPGNSLSFWMRAVIALPEQRWINPGSGNWNDPNNWGTGVVPNGNTATGNFLSDITGAATITIDGPTTVNTIRLNNANPITFAGTELLSFDGTAQAARNVNVEQGNHTFTAPMEIVLGSGTSALMNFNVARAQDVLSVQSEISINILGGQTLTIQKQGAGRLDINNIATPDTLFMPTEILVSGGTMRFLPGSGLNRVNGLSIAGGATPTAKLDITNNPMVIDYATPVPPATSPLATIKAQIASGFAGGSWNGNGIISSSANANTLGIGYAEASSLASVPAIFGTVDADTILIRLTRYGDANLDGQVNLSDFNRLAANFGATDADWARGDFNYDSNVNLSDFNRLAANFGLSAAGPDVTPEDWARLGAAVPEPGSVALLGLAGTLGLVRRRRRN